MANINLEVSAGQSKTITFQSAGKFTTEDVVFNVTGAAGSTTIATSSGTNQITLAHGTKYAITAAGSSYVFTMPAQYSHPSYTATTAGAYKIGNDATGHVVIGAALAKGDVGLGNVENKSSATIRSEITSSNVTTALGFTPLNKLTYEWNCEKAFGSSGVLLIGKFPMCDSNITIDIDSTTSITYHGTLVIATQNINTSRGGSFVCDVYGDAANSVAGSFKVQYSSGSNKFNVYFVPRSWSKNLIHIRANALAGAPTNICENVDSAPTTDLITINNILRNTYSLVGHNHSGVYKPVQTAVSDPTASSTTSTTFIDSISQNANGVITATKKTLPSYASSSHTHTTTIATSSATNQITLAFGTKYAITAGGTSYIFTMPSNPNTNTTYTIATGDSNGQIKVTPSSGSAYNVSVKGLGSAAYTESTAYAAASHTHSGYLTSSSSLNAANLTGTIPSGCYTDTNNFGTVIVDTPGNFAAKVGIVNFPYVLNAGNCFILNLINSNTVANATLNIRDTGAKDVYLDGAKVSASNWKAGTYLFYFDGERYNTSLKSNPFSDTNTTYTIETGDSNGQIKVTPSSGNAYNINVKGLGSAAYTASTAYATSGHTHTTSIATSTGTNKITLAFGTKYAITAGGTSYVFTMPANPNTDSNVQQDDFSNSANWHYPLLSNNYSSGALDGINGGDTGVVGFSIKLAVNPSEGSIYTAGYIQSESGFKVTGQSGFLMADGSIDSNSYSLSNHTHNYAASSHSHGSITSGGAISSGTALENGDAIVFSDSSNANKLKKSTITFDGSTTTKFLSQKGTWETPSGGGGSTVAGKTVELSTSNQALITVNGSDSGNVKLPDTCPWIADPANHYDMIGGVTPIFRADAPRVVINGSDGDFSDIQNVNSVDTLFLFPDVGKSHTLFALPVVMDGHGRLFVLISEALATDVFLNNGMSTDAGALSGK